MKLFVITIINNADSQRVANRCIESGRKHGYRVEKWKATTPEDKPLEIAKNLNIPIAPFKEKYSRIENCVAAFLSHRSLWHHASVTNTNICIFEHDAVITDILPINAVFKGILNVGAPSYGKFRYPTTLGIGPFVSKAGGYLGGAHAYMINPKGARRLLAATAYARPTDLYINTSLFGDILEEYYPWPVVANDSFTTTQTDEGCKAKHNFNATFEII